MGAGMPSSDADLDWMLCLLGMGRAGSDFWEGEWGGRGYRGFRGAGGRNLELSA